MKGKHIICFSGGHSSALVAIEVVRRYGKEDVILLNHDINSNVEDADIKRFKNEVANCLKIPITYANCLDITDVDKIPDQFDVTMIAKAFKVNNGSELCTNRLKTAPFYNWLKANANPDTTIIYYGFDAKERDRIIRRSKVLESMGYKSDYPLANWQRTIYSTEDIGINKPGTYSTFTRANCFTGDTEFITDLGIKKLIDEVDREVNVLTRDGWKSAVIRHFGQQEIVQVVMTNGSATKEILCTENHRWIKARHNHKSFGYEEITTVELKSGMFIPTVYSVPDIVPDRYGIQHGFTYGDGSLNHANCSTGGQSRVYIAECKEEILKFFDTKMTGSRMIHGLPKHFKSVPTVDKSKEYLLGFIVGLIASDGSVSKSGINIHNSSEREIVKIANICASLGLLGRNCGTKVRSTNYKTHASLSRLMIPLSSFKEEWILRSLHRDAMPKSRTEPKSWKIFSVKNTGLIEDVYCAVVNSDEYKEFALEGGVLTGNCIGCLKAGKQHWYIVYCTRPDIWEKGKKAEAYIGYTIHPGESLESMEAKFNAMKVAGIVPNELLPQQKFWAEVRKAVPGDYNYLQPNLFDMPCECVT